MHSRVNAVLAEAQKRYPAARIRRRTFAVPTVQMGPYGLTNENGLLHSVLEALPGLKSAVRVDLTTGYFAPTRELEDALIYLLQARPDSGVRLLCSSPQVRFF